ncbi:MAG TPA: hypothetical protein VNQ77_03295 [Frankiaceae bacterium]|nr:hypothetical protein [Frankiaceae bacterium]
MRRLLLAGLLAAAAIPAAPAHAGPAACVTAANFPVCAGTCSPGDPITVIVVGVSAYGRASCGGGQADCAAFKTPCIDTTGRATGSGQLTCSGTAPVVICLVGITAANSPYASLVS